MWFEKPGAAWGGRASDLPTGRNEGVWATAAEFETKTSPRPKTPEHPTFHANDDRFMTTPEEMGKESFRRKARLRCLCTSFSPDPYANGGATLPTQDSKRKDLEQTVVGIVSFWRTRVKKNFSGKIPFAPF